MTLNEFGLTLRRKFPNLEAVPLNNEDLAQYVLNLYPQYYDAISPTARRIKEISDRPRVSQKWWEGSRLANERLMVENDELEMKALHEADMLIKATSMGVPRESLGHLIEMDHAHHHTMELETFRRDNGLDGKNRHLLTPHELIDALQAKLLRCIDHRDAESHPDKRAVLTLRIKQLREEIHARGEQALVQAGGGDRLRHTDEDPEQSGNSGDSNTASAQQPAASKSRVGF
jgi:hypothetical protein